MTSTNNEKANVDFDASPSKAVDRMLSEIAGLCALSRLTEDAAVAIFREAYQRTQQPHTSSYDAAADPFAAAQVLTEWHENPQFLDENGAPAALSLSAGNFESLCKAAAIAADENTIVELLLHADAARRDGDLLHAARRELIVGDNHPAGVVRALRMCTHFAASLNHNLTRRVSEPGRFERSVENPRVSARHIPALIAYLSVHAQSFLEDLDSWMVARESNSPSASIGVGVYLYLGTDDK